MLLNCAEGWLGHLGPGSPRNDGAGLVTSAQSSFMYSEQPGKCCYVGKKVALSGLIRPPLAALSVSLAKLLSLLVAHFPHI